MPTKHIPELLIEERNKLSRAIEVLQGEKRRGRPPKNGTGTPTALNSPQAAPAKKNGRRKFTAAQRKQQAARMKAYWAAKKTGAGVGSAPSAGE